MVVTVNVELPDPPEVRLTLVGLKDNERPVTVRFDAPDSCTVPEKPLRLPRVTAEVAGADPATILNEGRLPRL